MLTIQPLDPKYPIQRQLEVQTSPVVLVNLFFLEPGDEQTFLEAWQHDANFMKTQPGYISTQLHRAVGERPCYFNYAVWESTDIFRAAFTNPEFRNRLSAYPASTVAMPHLFEKVAVAGVCVGA